MNTLHNPICNRNSRDDVRRISTSRTVARSISFRVLLFLPAILAISPDVQAAGDARRGESVFRSCAACHALEPGRHMTGPSLAGIWGKKAGTDPGFRRYSEALRHSAIVWNGGSLDQWLTKPQALVPGNYMTFQGLPDAQPRADLIAYLRVAASDGKASQFRQRASHPDLKKSPDAARVAEIRHCGDTYFVTTGTQELRPFWEFNLRFKTDSGPSGPAAGHPVLVSQGMQGDRAQIVFSQPGEISRFIREKCEK